MVDFLKQYYNNYFLGSLDRTLACLRKNVEAVPYRDWETKGW